MFCGVFACAVGPCGPVLRRVVLLGALFSVWWDVVGSLVCVV